MSEPNHPIGILWDMDGVLVDTGEFHYQAWAEVLPAFGLPFSWEVFRATFGMNNAGVINLLAGQQATPELVEAIAQRKEERFRQAIRGRVRPLPGVLDWLERFREWGALQALASSAPPANVDALLGELALRPYLTAIVPGSDLPSKPDPAVFLKAARLIEVAPQHCIVFEDAVAGVQAARRAGMRCIAVTTTNPAEALQEADLVVKGLDRLTPEAFQGLL